MCGIAGVINYDGEPVAIEVIKRMTDVIAHRGPDGEGQWVDGGVGLGHRRLAVLDPSPAGAQPMTDSTGQYVLSYNGEVYNFRELRERLEGFGTVFRSGTDTEVVLHALIRWGAEAVTTFNGMFSFAFFDREGQKLLLARDRYGIKPLYYHATDRTFSFGSEQRAIREIPGYSPQLDLEAMIEYFTFQNMFTDRTFDQGIRMLAPGTCLVVDLTNDGPRLTSSQYWDFRFEDPEVRVDATEYANELGRLFGQAVERNLISDVEVGSYLSGGMDSGSIAAVATNHLGSLKTFTCGFDMKSISGLELAFDERVPAERVAARFGTEHFEVVLKAGDLEKAIPKVVHHIEEPRIGQSYPNYYAASLASHFVKVVLSGAGGDELFGGYPWRYFSGEPGGSFESYIDDYYAYWQRLIPNSRLHRLFAPVRAETKHVITRDCFRNVFPADLRSAETSQDFINRSLYFEAKTFLHGLLVVDDKLSMAHGLETRVPFLDNDLVDFAMTCPVDLKLNRSDPEYRIDENVPADKRAMHYQRTRDGKLVLRSAMSRYLPDFVADSVKQGFSGPDASWFRGESLDYVKQRLLSPGNNLEDIMDPLVVAELVEEHVSGSTNHRLAIWSLLFVEELIGQSFR